MKEPIQEHEDKEGEIELSPSQEIALVHDAFLGDNDILSGEQRQASGVQRSIEPNQTDKLIIWGEIGGEPAYQSLARDRRGTYHLSTVFTKEGGKHIQHDFTPGVDKDDAEDMAAFEGSLFVQCFNELQSD
jgi:hypothetical protein